MDKIIPKVSVIMGIYNCAPYLQEALDSLYAQTFQDFKIILCDDGSKDETYAIAQRNAAEHPNILLVRNERNMGLNYTLNHCLEYADTEYCARMDGDDLSEPTRFEKEIAFLDAHPEYAIVSTPMIYFDENGEFMRGKNSGEPSKEVFNNSTPFCHAPCMVRTEAYKAVGGYTEDKRLLRHEDYNLWMKMFAAGYRGYNLPECLYAMRDDRTAVKRRKMRGRINGVYAHWLAYRTLNLSFIGWLKFSTINIMKGLAPNFVYQIFHKRH